MAAAGLDGAALDADRDAAFAEMRAAYAEAREAPFPPDGVAFTDVQDVGSPVEEAY